MKALSVEATPKMLDLARTLEMDDYSFRDLKWENQVLLAESQLSLDGLVTQQELQDYEIEKRVRESNTPLGSVRAKITRRLNGL